MDIAVGEYAWQYNKERYQTNLSTICPGSSDPFCIVTYYIKWVKTTKKDTKQTRYLYYLNLNCTQIQCIIKPSIVEIVFFSYQTSRLPILLSPLSKFSLTESRYIYKGYINRSTCMRTLDYLDPPTSIFVRNQHLFIWNVSYLSN